MLFELTKARRCHTRQLPVPSLVHLEMYGYLRMVYFPLHRSGLKTVYCVPSCISPLALALYVDVVKFFRFSVIRNPGLILHMENVLI